MVSINQLRNGFVKYAETDLISGQTGLTRAVVKGVVNLYASRAEEIIKALSEIQAIKMLKIVDGNMVDVEALYNAFAPEVQGKIEIEIPLIGTMSFDREELDKLMSRIKDA